MAKGGSVDFEGPRLVGRAVVGACGCGRGGLGEVCEEEGVGRKFREVCGWEGR